MSKYLTRKSSLLTFVYGFFTKIVFDFIGKLFFSEILSVLLIPFINFRFLFKKYKGLFTILICFLTLFVFQIFSDIFNNSLQSDYLRGWASLLISFISIIVFIHFFDRNKKNIITYLFSLFIANILFGEVEISLDNISENSNYYKVRVMPFINIGVLLLSFYIHKKKGLKFIFFLFFFFSFFSFLMDARSSGVIFLISSLLIYIKIKNIIFTKFKILKLSLAFLGISYFFFIAYVYSVKNLNFGGLNSKNQIALMNNQNNPFGLLGAGRGELLIAFIAIADKPLFGHGSWAKDKTGKYHSLQELTLNKKIEDRGFIPNHSLLFGSWLYSGFFGFLSLLFIFRLVLFKYFKIFSLNINDSLFPVLTFLVVRFCWDIFFSPYNQLRTSFPLVIAFVCYSSWYFDKINLEYVKNK